MRDMLVTEGSAIEDTHFDLCSYSSIVLCLELESIMTEGNQRGFNTLKHGVNL